MCDQLRHDWLGFSGASQVCTPAVDGVASRGMRFTQCTTNSPVCAPARIGLATGLQPYRVGALDNSAYLPQSVPTYYQRLRDHGYRVGCVGKLDLAKPDPFNGRYGERPCAYGWGFTHPVECEGKQHAGRHNVPVGPYTTYLAERGLLARLHDDYDGRRTLKQTERRIASHDSVLPLDAYEDVYVGRRAVEWIDTYACDFPWHLIISFVVQLNTLQYRKQVAKCFFTGIRVVEILPRVQIFQISFLKLDCIRARGYGSVNQLNCQGQDAIVIDTYFCNDICRLIITYQAVTNFDHRHIFLQVQFDNLPFVEME